ncbi:VOC family protein, partial [Chitinophaga sp.]|uniref:VOC family protein n=1 Tax=Chitinophaga sp. TaxID=1869181 RepID=UPI002632F094
IWEEGYEKTADLLTSLLDHQLIGQHDNRFRFAAADKPGNYIDILCSPDSLRGLSGGGTVHHIAFATPDRQAQTEVRGRLMEKSFNPTPILDRNYFTSIYFREPGGVLFEIATSGPGFAVDEAADHLGEELKLPQQYEPMRAELLASLPKVSVQLDHFR